MIVLGLDPGTEKSAVVLFNGISSASSAFMPNTQLVEWLRTSEPKQPILVIEQVESFGMAVGAEVFETVFWAGRFAEAWYPARWDRLPRRIIKQHLCHTARATDANIRQALIDRFGGQEKAIGKKASPGPLYPLKGHLWAAFAVAITYWDQHHADGEQIRLGVQAEF